MNLPSLREGLIRGIGSLSLPQSFGAMATLTVAALFFFIVVVSLLGDADDGEPKQVLKIEHAPPTGTGGPAIPESSLSTMSLVAVNGVVISDPTLIEMVADGPLPKIAADGRKAMDVYARAFDRSDPRPKIAVVVGGLGLGEAVTQAAIDRLPPGITLAVTPYGSSLQAIVSTARAKGHEVLLELPLEPYDYPDNDPGQDTLLTGQTAPENPERLRRVLSKVTGYAGVINSQGSKFLASGDEVRALLAATTARGLYFLDNGEAEQSLVRDVAQGDGRPFARGDRQLDKNPTREAIEKEFVAIEGLAKQRGAAIGVAAAFPVTVDRVTAWAQSLEEKGIALVPVSALVQSAVVVAPAVRPQPRRAPVRSKPEPALAPEPAPELPTDPQPAFEPTAPHP